MKNISSFSEDNIQALIDYRLNTIVVEPGEVEVIEEINVPEVGSAIIFEVPVDDDIETLDVGEIEGADLSAYFVPCEYPTCGQFIRQLDCGETTTPWSPGDRVIVLPDDTPPVMFDDIQSVLSPFGKFDRVAFMLHRLQLLADTMDIILKNPDVPEDDESS